jgi:hypothetical protein
MRHGLIGAFLGLILAVAQAAMAPAWARDRASNADALLDCGLTEDDLVQAFGAPDQWWPLPPEFLGTLDFVPGLKTLVVQTFRATGGNRTDRLLVSLSLYGGREVAEARFRDLLLDDIRAYGPAASHAPEIGEGARLHLGIQPRGATLRLHAGPFILRLTHWSDGPLLSQEELARLARPILGRLEDLKNGKRPLPALPALASALPPAGGAFSPVLGTAAGPPEWGAFLPVEGDMQPSPMLRDFLIQQMAPPEIITRRYALKSVAGTVVDVTLFPMADPGSAQAWMNLDRETRDPSRVQLMPLASLPSYLVQPSGERGTSLDLLFAKGRFVGEISCGAPLGYASGACGKAVLEMAGDLVRRLQKN